MSEARESYQYALLRVVPSLARGERVNVGVVLFSRRARFLAVRAALDEQRLLALSPELDIDALRAHLQALARVAQGDPSAGPVAGLDQSDRFGWLVAPSSTIVQPSSVHTGLCDDPAAALERLVAELVR